MTISFTSLLSLTARRSKRIPLAILGLALCLAMVTGATLPQQAKLTDSDGLTGDRLGYAIAISGDTVVVGAPFDTLGNTGSDRGSVSVFVRTGTTWTQQAKLTASDGANEDHFGKAVAISGDTIVVGAPDDDINNRSAQGSAYVFVRSGTTWAEQQKLTAGDGDQNELFGNSVAISGDTVVVGAMFHPVGGNTAQGAAYVFARSGGAWSQQQKLTAADGAAGDNLGTSVAIDGNTVVAGAPGNDSGAAQSSGAAYVFARAGASWAEQQKLTASNVVSFEGFGAAVAVSGNTAVAGTRRGVTNVGNAYVFARAGSTFVFQQELVAGDGVPATGFGLAVAVSGEAIVVGARADDIGASDDQGSAYVFTRAGNSWSEYSKLVASDGVRQEQFGYSVGISGNTVAVGVPSGRVVNVSAIRGSAYVFVNTPPAITANTPLTVNKGGSPKPFVIANASDPDQPLDSLQVIAIPVTGSGVTLSNLTVNAAGEVIATLQATCDATRSTFTLTVMDSFAATASTQLVVNVGPDVEPPQITCPGPVTAVAPPACPLSTATVVSYGPPAVIDNCPGTTVACTPPSGSAFAVGTTTVTCTARDAAGNSASCAFAVTVFDVRLQDDTNPSTVLLFNSQSGQYRLCYGGNTYTGTGVVTKRGCSISLTHNATDRRLQATVDTAASRGNASVQIPVGVVLCSISDRDLRNDSALCQ